MKNITILLTILGFYLAVASAMTLNQELSRRSYITGLVYKSSSRQPVSSVLVVVSQGNTVKGQSLTGDDGRYYIARLKKGEYNIVVKKSKSKVLFRGKVQLPKNKYYNIKIEQNHARSVNSVSLAKEITVAQELLVGAKPEMLLLVIDLQ